MVISYRRFGTNFPSHPKGSRLLKPLEIATTRCVITQKGAFLKVLVGTLIVSQLVKKFCPHSTKPEDPSRVHKGRPLFVAELLDCVWNVMAHAQKPDFVFRRNGRVYLNRRGLQFSRLLAAELCASAVVMLDTPRSEVVWRVLATHSIRQFPLHFPSRASPCAITIQLDSPNPEA